ncbi:MAG TPA: gliding motility-associated C-terminal domain-containing protein [Saprospiraceae bacterium]|nr:gliding motility-associated C-terminal domain-containing protein [Saprospiraceae bacterium]
MKQFSNILVIFLLGMSLNLHAQPGNGFTCQEAACLSENLGVTLNNGGSPPSPPLTFSCGITHNNLFYSFCPETGTVVLEITPSNCTTGLGVQAIIYETDDCTNFQELVCISNGNTNPFTINFNGTPGQPYILMIDGFSGDVCDFTVSATGITSITGPPLEPELDPSDDPLLICQDDQVDIEVINADQNECTAYFWEVQSGLGVISLDENGTTATITGVTEGFATVCVTADNFCYETQTCIEVEVQASPDLDPIAPISSCDQFVDFCDYIEFFDPPLTPDPDAEGWTITFHENQADAESGDNEIACPFDLGTFGTTTIWIRTEISDLCFSVISFTIEYVDCCEAEAGTISANPTEVCPGESIDVTVTGYQTDSDYSQHILIVDNTGVVIEIIDGDSYELTSDICQDFILYSYNYLPTSDAPDPTIGLDPQSVDCSDDANCCDWAEVTVSFVDSEVPIFDNPPGDLVLECFDQLPDMNDLDWTDNCVAPGSSVGVEDGGADLCGGGSITRTWEAEDLCGNVATHTQSITVNPPQPIAFEFLPPDGVVLCDMIPGDADPLNYTNNGTGDCLFEGSVDPIRTDNYDICGGEITNLWEATDPCGNTIEHTQTYTVRQAPPPFFTSLPADEIFSCEDFVNNPDDLEYTNSSSGNCLIEGSVSPVSSAEPDLCGGTMTNTWEFTDPCGRVLQHTQTITVEPAPEAIFIDPPQDITIECGEFIPQDDLEYSNNAGGNCLIEGFVSPVTTPSTFPCAGLITNTWTAVDPCGRTIEYTQNITIEPAPEAEWLDAPEDITISCTEDLREPLELVYSNFEGGICQIEGNITAVQTGEITPCGSEVILSWDFTDVCNRRIEHQQVITIEPGEMPEFLFYPDDEVIECSEIPEEPQALPYSNFDNNCPIEGEVMPAVTENYDSCGGEIIYVWEFTDQCGNTIEHTQILEIEPLRDPDWIDPPFDIDLDCGEAVPPPQPLAYSNFEEAPCNLEGEVMPQVERNGQETVYRWEFQNACTGELIEHEQFIFDPIEPDLVIEPSTDTICRGENYNLGSIQIFDQNNSDAIYSYHEGFPPTPGNQLTNLNVSPDQDQIYSITGNSLDDCEDTIQFQLIVLEAPDAGDDGSGYLCYEAENVNLFDYLNGQDNNNGRWTDPLGSGIDLSDPANVSFVGEPAGLYIFDYILSSASCAGDTARIEITINEEIRGDVLRVQCSQDRMTYTVILEAYGNNVSINAGSLDGPNGTQYTINDIPVMQVLTIELTTGQDSCVQIITVNPPNCDCPQVDAPQSLGDLNICFGEAIPTLRVTVGPNDGVNWYDQPNGGTLLAGNTTSYTPMVSAPGVYTFYAEAYNLAEPDCISPIRTPVRLTISRIPLANSAELMACDDDTDNILSWDLTTAEPLLSPESGLNFSFHITRADAENQNNALPNAYDNTSNPQTLYVNVSNASGCDTVVTLLLEVLPLPEITLDIENEVCLGEENGSVSILSPSNNGNPEYSLNDFFYQVESTFDSLAPGPYTAYVRDTAGCKSSLDFTIEEGLDLSIVNFDLVCSDNGTNTDDTDDIYTLTLQIDNNKNNIGSFDVLLGATVLASGNYGSTITITLDADGSTPTLEFVDSNTGCTITRQVGPLTPCSTDCELTINLLDTLCNDNGTPLDPTDDFYNVTINVSGVNASPTNQYRLSVNGTRIGIYNYDEDESFTIPVTMDPVTIQLEDLVDNQCVLTRSLGILTSCSDDCLVETLILQLLCDDAGTMGVEEDDTYTFYLSGNSINASDRWYVQGLTDTLNNGDSLFFGPFLIADGPVQYILFDALRDDCPDTITVNPPRSCSNPCELVLNDLFVSDCDDNNTGPTSVDDRFYIEFRVDINFGPTTQFELTDGDTTWGPFNYGELIRIENLLADGSTYNLTLTDTLSPQCELEFEVSRDPCSSCEQTADAGSDFEITCAVPEVQLQGTSSEPGIYQWTGPTADTFNVLQPLVDVPGTYILQVTYNNQCIVVDSAIVTLDDDIPIADAGPDTFLTCAITEFTLSGSRVSGSSNISVEWTDESGNIISTDFTVLISAPGRYFFQIIDNENACRSPRDEVVVGLDNEAPDPTIFADPTTILDCVVEEILLSSLDEDNVIYTWTIDNENFEGPVKIIVDSSLVTLTAINTLNGCDSTNSINVEDFTEFPFIDLEQPDIIDCYTPSVTLDANDSQRSSGLSIEWTDEDGNLLSNDGYELEVDEPGLYYFTLSDSLIGCTRTDSAIVDTDLDAPLLEAGDDQSVLCNPDTVLTLSASVPTGSDIEVEWQTDQGQILDGQNSLNPQISGSGVYTISALNSDNGCTTSDSILVEINTNLPELLQIANRDVRCQGENNGTINILEVEGGFAPYSMLLNGNPQTNSTFVGNLAPGNYTIRITDANNCFLDTTIVIREGRELLTQIPAEIEVDFADSETIYVLVSVPEEEISNVQWIPEENLSCDTCLITEVDGVESGVYEVVVTDTAGCVSRASIRVFVRREINIYAPNSFSPNGDGVNDFFTIYGDKTVNNISELAIFDRWGNLLFRNENFPASQPEFGWDGSFKDKPMNPAVFVYYAEVELFDGTTELIKGDVTLFK